MCEGRSPLTCHPFKGAGCTEPLATGGWSRACLPWPSRASRLSPTNASEAHYSSVRPTVVGAGLWSPPRAGAPSACTHSLLQSQHLIVWHSSLLHLFK